MTEKVSFIKIAGLDGVEVEHAIIDRGDGNFTSMTKEAYDLLQVEHLTEKVPNEVPTK